ncbi:hypothetical protein NX774_11090 [Massilia agilis]|uniref:Lipoprotein n=1 Tax=Massilia agilis TaxID=1811226 RepID=A0ABT2DAX4_9BURK|nr:hypothetical protein [Massilia agilis]MCS0808464.1 hypothetical protein [Massilia agilis]
MHTRYIPWFVLVASTLTGCTVAPTAGISSVPQATASPSLVDAPPGDYRKFSSKIDASLTGRLKTMRVVTKAVRLQPSKEWAPTIIFCLKNNKNGGEYCLNTYAVKDGTRIVAKFVNKEAEFNDVITTRLPFDLAPADYHYLDLMFSEDKLIMIIDDEKVVDHPVHGLMDEYWFGCSSIICSVQVIYPFSPPTD